MIYLFLAEGFEEVEALTPADILRRAGACVRTVSLQKNLYVRGAHEIEVKADITLNEVEPDKAKMYILPGGKGGTDNLAASKEVARLLRDAAERGVFIGAICAAPSVLGRLGLLKGRRAACYHGGEQYLEGAEYTGAPVERDGTYITARGMGVSLEFSLALVSALYGDYAAEKIKDSTMAV